MPQNTIDQFTPEQLFNATANGVIITNCSGIILKANLNALKIFQKDEQTLVGSSVYTSLPIIGKVIYDSLDRRENVRGYLVSDDTTSVVLNTSIIREKDRIIEVATSFQETAVFEKIAKKFEFYQLQSRQLSKYLKKDSR